MEVLENSTKKKKRKEGRKDEEGQAKGKERSSSLMIYAVEKEYAY